MSISQASIDALFSSAVEPSPTDLNEVAVAERGGGGPPAHSDPRPAEKRPQADTRRILGLSLPVTVTLAERDMAVEMILAIRVGTILEFDVAFDAELTLSVAGHGIGKGHAVKVGENFGLRITKINSLHDRIEALGGEDSS